MNLFELERETAKMSRAMMTRNTAIGKDLIAHLKEQLTLEGVAGVMLVSIERVLWFDTESVFWSIEHLIPADVMQEMQKMTQLSVYKRLIRKGLIPGIDFSVDGEGKMLLNEKARAVMGRCA